MGCIDTLDINCPAKDCRDAFDSLAIVPRINGGTMVSWDINTTDMIPPVMYQLQYSNGGSTTDDDWVAVDYPITDTSFLIDPERRNHGFYRYGYYRVVAIDVINRAFVSQPISSTPGNLPPSQARDYREVVRRETKRYSLKDTEATAGYLLKIRHHGPRCNSCRDPDSGEPTNPNCGQCYGVGYQAGYYPKHPCFNLDIKGAGHDLKTNQESGIQIDQQLHSLRYLNMPYVKSRDIWVDAASDYRYEVRTIQPITVFGSHDLVCSASAARLPFDHPVYRVEVQPVPGLTT